MGPPFLFVPMLSVDDRLRTRVNTWIARYITKQLQHEPIVVLTEGRTLFSPTCSNTDEEDCSFQSK